MLLHSDAGSFGWSCPKTQNLVTHKEAEDQILAEKQTFLEHFQQISASMADSIPFPIIITSRRLVVSYERRVVSLGNNNRGYN